MAYSGSFSFTIKGVSRATNGVRVLEFVCIFGHDALAPVVELAPSDPAPLNDLLDRKLGLGGDCVHEVDNLVTPVMGNPGTTQASPSFFLSVTYSSVTSAMI